MLTRSERNEEKQKEIIKEEHRETRKKIVLTCFKIIIILILISIIFYLYTSYISSKIITVKEERITSEKLPSNFNGLKIIQISDIHYGSTIFINDIKRLIKLINRRTPDLVVFTGDLIDKNYQLTSKEQENLITELKKIKTTIGKYAIKGEEDTNQFNTIMKQSQFTKAAFSPYHAVIHIIPTISIFRQGQNLYPTFKTARIDLSKTCFPVHFLPSAGQLMAGIFRRDIKKLPVCTADGENKLILYKKCSRNFQLPADGLSFWAGCCTIEIQEHEIR